jgi:hypothetical protein
MKTREDVSVEAVIAALESLRNGVESLGRSMGKTSRKGKSRQSRICPVTGSRIRVEWLTPGEIDPATFPDPREADTEK